jgi:Arc/MetJ-type ribon-helix-helix transcriptional regulator
MRGFAHSIRPQPQENLSVRGTCSLLETPMGEKVRLNLQLSSELNEALEEIVDDTGTSRSEVIRQALALMKVAHSAKKQGRHIGLVSDPKKLETEIIGLL